MPKQEVFFEQQIGERRIEVLKSYDQAYAREAFKNMDEEALHQLWTALKPEKIYDPVGLPALGDPEGEGEAFLWDELLEQAREDGPLLSFFIVNEMKGRLNENLFVSPDWPSAEAFAKNRIACLSRS
jgi:hypothetical protein